jgi:hypothetical protein
VGGDEQQQFDGEDAREAESYRTRAVWLRLVSKIEILGTKCVVWPCGLGGGGWGRWALAKPLSMTLERPLSISKGPLSLTKAQHPSVTLIPSDSHHRPC